MISLQAVQTFSLLQQGRLVILVTRSDKNHASCDCALIMSSCG